MQKNKITLKYFQEILKRLKWKKSILLFVANIEGLKTLKYINSKKHYSFLLFSVSVAVKMKRYLKKKSQLRS